MQCRLVADFQKLGREKQKALLQHGLAFIRESITFGITQKRFSLLNKSGLALVRQFSQHLSLQQLESMVQLLENAIVHIGRNANPKVLFLHLSIQVTDLCGKSALVY